MLETKSAAALNSYNVAQLQFEFNNEKIDDAPVIFADDIDLSPSPNLHSVSDIDYATRRMSSSATSTDSSARTRGEKRTLSPSASPQPGKRIRVGDGETSGWGVPGSSSLQVPYGRHSSEDNKVQLPSIFTSFKDEDPYKHDALRRASLPSLYSDNAAARHKVYQTASSSRTPQTPLNAYTFPPTSDLGYPEPSPSYSASTLMSSSTFTSPASAVFSGRAQETFLPYNTEANDGWSPGIVRPNSTPGLVPNKPYDDGMRHASFSGANSQLYGAPRIAGQSERRASLTVKLPQPDDNTDQQWPYSAPNGATLSAANFGYNSGSQSALPPPPPVRKRGKLPKETTDFLKSWLHRHADHPYPSEEEKKQLCHATGLSMSQVSNWMINARRRILAPANKAASAHGAVRTFDPHSRRSSAPSSDSLQLYQPLSLQSLPQHPQHHAPQPTQQPYPAVMGSSRYAMPPRYHSGPAQYMGPQSAGGLPNRHLGMGGYANVPMSAPATMAGSTFSPPYNGHTGSVSPFEQHQRTPRAEGQGLSYFTPEAQHDQQQLPSAPGSGYPTPQ